MYARVSAALVGPANHGGNPVSQSKLPLGSGSRDKCFAITTQDHETHWTAIGSNVLDGKRFRQRRYKTFTTLGTPAVCEAEISPDRWNRYQANNVVNFPARWNSTRA